MSKSQKIADLIGSIYDTALDAAAWTAALPGNKQVCWRKKAGGLFSKDLVSKLGDDPLLLWRRSLLHPALRRHTFKI